MANFNISPKVQSFIHFDLTLTFKSRGREVREEEEEDKGGKESRERESRSRDGGG